MMYPKTLEKILECKDERVEQQLSSLQLVSTEPTQKHALHNFSLFRSILFVPSYFMSFLIVKTKDILKAIFNKEKSFWFNQ